jgi:hypothetical protein
MIDKIIDIATGLIHINSPQTGRLLMHDLRHIRQTSSARD